MTDQASRTTEDRSVLRVSDERLKRLISFAANTDTRGMGLAAVMDDIGLALMELSNRRGFSPEPGGVDRWKAAYEEARDAELFEDGCEVDLREAKIETLTDAYIAGRQDVLAEIDLAAKQPPTKVEKPVDNLPDGKIPSAP